MKRFLLALLSASLLTPVFADPPAHAPAHGWRKKHDPYYRGYTGAEWPRDFGISAGRCNTDEVLAALGAVAGGVIGYRTASAEHRTVATIVGAIAGGVVGAAIGDRIDDRDRACMGHAMEIAPVGRAVAWTNPASAVTYRLKPLRDVDGRCREVELVAARARESSQDRLLACRSGAGVWSFTKRI